MKSPCIRSICRSDVDALVSLAEEFEEHLNSLSEGRCKKPSLTREVFLRDAFGPKAAFDGLLMEVDGEILGYVLYHQGYNADFAVRTIQVIDLFVKNKSRQSGLGTALMRALIPVCIKAGASLICTSVWTLNPGAENFYKRLGAELVKDETIVCWPQEKW